MEKLSIYALFIFLFLTSCYSRQHTAAWHAEEFKNQGKYQEAIDKYKEHIETVSKNEKINKDYNASFYNLLIGDCYLELNNPDESLKYYLLAKTEKVDPRLVAGKIRTLASWYADKKDYQKAIDLLKEHREMDILLFDLDADSYYKSSLSE